MIAQANHANITCYGFNNGSAQSVITGGTEPYNINWDNGESSEFITNLTPGNYSFSVTDFNNCPTAFSNTVEVLEPSELLIDSISIDSVNCFGGNDGQITYFVSGGTPQYNHFINNQTVVNNPHNVSAGTYSYHVIDANNCTTLYPNNLDVFEPTPITPPIVTYNPDTICYNSIPGIFEISTLASGGGGDAPYTYQWMYLDTTNTPTVVSSINSISYQHSENLTEDSKFWIATFSDYGCGPANSDTIFIPVYEDLNPGNIITNDTICHNTSYGDIEFITNPTGVNGVYNYEWQIDNGSGWGIADNNINANSYQQNYNHLDNVKYRVLVSTTCTTYSTNEFQLSVYDEFIPGSIGSNQELCFSELASDLELNNVSTGGSPFTNVYQWQQFTNNTWSDIANQNVTFFNPGSMEETTEYRLQITDGLCSSDSIHSNSITILVNPLPESVNILGPNNTCQNSSDVYYSISDYDDTFENIQYNWSISNSNINSFSDNNISWNTLVDWGNNSGNEQIIIRQTLMETGCVNYDTLNVFINNGFAPDKSNIIKSENSEMLICEDNSVGLNYQWGYHSILGTDSLVDASDTLQFIHYDDAHNHIINEAENRYWVDTWFDSSCKTRSYYNWDPFAVNIDVEEIDEFKIYPNPTSDILYLELPNMIPLSIKVVDILGAQTILKINDFDNHVDVSSLKNGAYFIIVELENSIITKKFIVKK